MPKPKTILPPSLGCKTESCRAHVWYARKPVEVDGNGKVTKPAVCPICKRHGTVYLRT